MNQTKEHLNSAYLAKFIKGTPEKGNPFATFIQRIGVTIDMFKNKKTEVDLSHKRYSTTLPKQPKRTFNAWVKEFKVSTRYQFYMDLNNTNVPGKTIFIQEWKLQA